MGCISNFFQKVKFDLSHLNSIEPNRTRGVLWITAGVVSVVCGGVLASLGGVLSYSATVSTVALVGYPIGWAFAGVGISMIIAGVPMGVWIASMFVSRGWRDLTAEVRPIPVPVYTQENLA